MNVRAAVEADRASLARYAAALQERPARHVAYLGVAADTIAAEMIEEDDDWTAVCAVIEVVGKGDAGLGGWLMGSIDVDMGRVWWYGPFVDADGGDWTDAVDALYAAAQQQLPAAVREQEMAVDERFELLVDWAGARGFVRDPGSAVLTLDHGIDGPTIATRLATAADRGTVGVLHDQLFPKTHTTGDTLVSNGDATHVRLVAEIDGAVAGYVAVERQPDGDGYIDYLGVDPGRRREGLGLDLVRAAVAALDELGCARVSLTVREDNEAARALYRRLGFVEERVLVPLRKGFSIA